MSSARTGSSSFRDIDLSRVETWYCPRCRERNLSLESSALVCGDCDAYSPDGGRPRLNEKSGAYMGRLMRGWIQAELQRERKLARKEALRS